MGGHFSFLSLSLYSSLFIWDLIIRVILMGKSSVKLATVAKHVAHPIVVGEEIGSNLLYS